MSKRSKLRCGGGYVDCLDRCTSRVSPTDKKKSEGKRPHRLTLKQRLASKMYNLELDVSELRQQLNALEVHRSLLHTRALFTQRDLDGSAFKKALEYFNVFKRGYRFADSTPPAYIAAVADHQLTLGTTGLGRDMLLEQWRRYTAYFGIRFYKIHSVRVIAADDLLDSCVLRAEGEFHGVFTREALETAFPCVLDDVELTQELLGLAMVTPVAFVLHFNEHGRMVRHDGEADWFTTLSRALGNPVRAASIMQHAKLAEEDMIDAAASDQQLRVEPIEQTIRIKRLCFARSDTTGESMVREPESVAKSVVDGRHSVAFMLS